MKQLNPWIEGYLEYLRDVRRLAAGTLRDVRCTLNTLCEVMEKMRPAVPLWKLSLDDYLLWINRKRDEGYSEHSLAKQLSHIRGLLDYAWRSARSDRNVLDGFNLKDDQQRKPPRCLTVEEAERLVRALPRRTKLDRANRVLVLLLYGCGLRTSELCRLNVVDVDLEKQEIFVKKGKGLIQRRVPVPDGVWTEVLAYLAERRAKKGALLKTPYKGKRLDVKGVNAVVKQAVARARIEGKVTAKTLRHSFATHLMDRDVDLGVIAMLMGHRSPTETGVYLHVRPGKLRETVAKLEKEEEL
jgi:integrase/recombinase XerD